MLEGTRIWSSLYVCMCAHPRTGCLPTPKPLPRTVLLSASVTSLFVASTYRWKHAGFVFFHIAECPLCLSALSQCWSLIPFERQTNPPCVCIFRMLGSTRVDFVSQLLCCGEHGSPDTSPDRLMRIPAGYVPSSELAGTYRSSSFSRNLQNYIPWWLHSRFHPLSVVASFPPHPWQLSLLFAFFVITILMR